MFRQIQQVQRSQAAASVSKSLQMQTQQVRTVKTKGRTGPNLTIERVVTQLSVLSANRKQPKLLRLSNEDYVKHLTVRQAWSRIRKAKKEANEEQLRKQYESITMANEEFRLLAEQDEGIQKLYNSANVREHGKRFPMELRVPTAFPPRQVWYYDYNPAIFRQNQSKKD